MREALQILKRRAERLTRMANLKAESTAPWRLTDLRRLQNYASKAWHAYYEAELKSRPVT